MGLKHQALHAMLANPSFAPFELIDGRQLGKQDWILIDHLMVIYRVKPNDYVQDDPRASIRNMARTVARSYASEDSNSRFVVLVKDGVRSQKPRVRESRLRRSLPPHIAFCKRNLGAIEYTLMKLLADVGMKDKLFLVTGAEGEKFDSEGPAEKALDSENLVCFHQKYMEYRLERGDRGESGDTIDELFDEDPSSCTEGSIERPRGLAGVFVATFADPETAQVTTLREACVQCASTEADTLLVELANILKGNVTVCTGDSDLVAVLTASGREGITLRLNNYSYNEHRDMHESPFSDMFVAVERDWLHCDWNWFRILCDVTPADEHLMSAVRERHDTFVAVLDKIGDCDFKENAFAEIDASGIMGSLYNVFLSRFLSTNVQSGPESFWIAVNQRGIRRNPLHYIFETLRPATPDEESLSTSHAKYDSLVPRPGRKRKCLGHEPEVSLEDRAEPEQSGLRGEQKGEGVPKGFERLRKAYVNKTVPCGSYGRFTKLSRAGQHFYMRITIAGNSIQDEIARREKLIFMVLCGTDYNLIPMGLGTKRLLRGVLREPRAFSDFCGELNHLWWIMDTNPPLADVDYRRIVMKLQSMVQIPRRTLDTHWTTENCKLMVKTMKYVCELWSLKKPKPGPEYGFLVRDGVVSFDNADSRGGDYSE